MDDFDKFVASRRFVLLRNFVGLSGMLLVRRLWRLLRVRLVGSGTLCTVSRNLIGRMWSMWRNGLPLLVLRGGLGLRRRRISV